MAAGSDMYTVTIGPFIVALGTGAPPDLYDHFKRDSRLVEEFDLERLEARVLTFPLGELVRPATHLVEVGLEPGELQLEFGSGEMGEDFRRRFDR